MGQSKNTGVERVGGAPLLKDSPILSSVEAKLNKGMPDDFVGSLFNRSVATLVDDH